MNLRQDELYDALARFDCGTDPEEKQSLQLCCAAEVDSTNDWAKREAAAGAPDGTVFLADHQTAGKGRRGRIWKSPEGTSVAMSVLLRPALPADRLSMLTLVMGLAAAEGIHAATGLETGIKWPNDVVFDGRKLCGILTELGADAAWVVIGIGLNVNMTEFPEELRDIATSMRIACGYEVSRETVAAAVISRFRTLYRCFCETGDLSRLRTRYEKLLVNRNAHVRVLDPRAPFEGVARGISDCGELMVCRDDTGALTRVYAGEVSVRGLYGYV